MQHFNKRIKQVLVMGVITISVGLYGCSSSNDTAQADQNDTDGSSTTGIGRTEDSAIGAVFAFGNANRTLYTFANDDDNVSNCTGGCLEVWPPVIAASATTEGQFGTIELSDGRFQFTFKSRPVYYFQGDAAAGEINGEGSGGVWFVTRPDPISTGTTALGTVLVGAGNINDGSGDPAVRNNVDGLTLYTFRNDSLNTSVCNGQCAVVWPPLYADAGALPADDFTLITRADNTVQWAQNGQPLYFFQGDSAAGDTNGNGVNGVWEVAVPVSR